MSITPTTLLLTGFAQVLARFSSSPHFSLNLTLFNRLPLHADINHLIGDFTALTLLEIDMSQGETLQARANVIHSQLWRDLDNRLFGGIQVSTAGTNSPRSGEIGDSYRVHQLAQSI